MDKPIVLILGHGSREVAAHQAFKRLVRQFAAATPLYQVRHAFLELASPSLLGALESLALSSSRILVLPLFLFASGHIRRDIPRILKKFQRRHPMAEVQLRRELGVDPLMARLVDERSKKLKGEPAKTWVLLVGRGAREKKVQKEFCQLVRLYAKNRGFQKVEGCSMDLALPSLEQRLEKIRENPPAILWVLPYLLFPGKLMGRIEARMKVFARENPTIRVQVGSALGFHPLLLELLRRRLKAQG